MTLGILVMLSVSVIATDICEDVLDLGEECTMLTPTLFCTAYNYSIQNKTGNVVQIGDLTAGEENIYYFNYNYSNVEGGYLVNLCDGTTREIYVKGEQTMNITIMNLTFSGILSIISTIGLICLTILSLYNIFNLATYYDIKASLILFIIKILTFGLALFTSMLDYTSLLSGLMLKISALFMVLQVFFFIAEIFMYTKDESMGSVQAYTPQRRN